MSRVPAAVVDEVRARSRGRCERCWADGRGWRAGEQLHHRVTRARGGPHDARNLAHLCERCHREVHAGNVRPWLLPGLFVRGVYTGPWEEYREAYR